MAGVTLHPLWTYRLKKVGYFFAHSMTTDLISNALDNAYYLQNPDKGLIFHPDLGSQYTGDEFREIIHKYEMIHSFSYKGSPYDNSCIESFHAILKNEEVNHLRYIDYQAAKVAMFKFTESWYNGKRIHGSLDYKTPQEVENESLKSVA